MLLKCTRRPQEVVLLASCPQECCVFRAWTDCELLQSLQIRSRNRATVPNSHTDEIVASMGNRGRLSNRLSSVLLALVLWSCGDRVPGPPIVESVMPSSKPAGAALNIAIRGSAFYQFTSANLDDKKPARADDRFTATLVRSGLLPIELEGVAWTNLTSLSAVVPGGLEVGSYDLVVTGPLGASNTLVGAFTVCADEDGDGTCGCIDRDRDGFGAEGDQSTCANVGNDCNDAVDSIFPGAPEVADDTVDQDCNGNDTVSCFLDGDMDGFGTDLGTIKLAPDGSCETSQQESTVATDCDDSQASTFPGAAPNDGTECMKDVDGDDFGDQNPPAPVTPGSDCDDMSTGCVSDCIDADFDGTPVCAGDCDDSIATGVSCTTGCTVFLADADGDGFGDASSPASAASCVAPTGFVANSTDCDDNPLACGSSCFPGNPAADICDGDNQDCDALLDENPDVVWFADADGDNFGNPASSTNACTQPAGFVANNLDCADNPAGDAVCGGLNGNFCNPLAGEGPSGDATCGDNADNDCDTDTDDADADCTATTTTITLRFDNSGIGENLIDFPVLVTLTPGNFDYGSAEVDGSDLLFEDDDASTVLPHEIDVWNPGGTSQIWVLVPQIDAGSSTDHIFLTYGDVGIAPGEDADTLWSAYHGVWHMQENGDGTADEFRDSSPQNNHGQGGGGDASRVPNLVAGQIGNGQTFDGDNDRILISPSDSFNFSEDAVSMEYWASPNLTGGPMVAIGKGGFPTGYRSGIEFDGRVGWLVAGTLLDTVVVASAEFHHIVVTWNGSTMRTYVDGVERASQSKGGSLGTNSSDFFIGRGPIGFEFRGIIDEARVINEGLSGPWIEAQFRTTSNTYITFE